MMSDNTSLIKSYIKHLDEGINSLCIKRIKIESTSSGVASDLVDESSEDIFNLMICIAGETMKWQIIFDIFNTDIPPDILIINDDEFDPEYDKILSLMRWNKENPLSLLEVVRELVDAYKSYERMKCLKIDADICRQIDVLCQSYEKVELGVFNNDGSGRVISVMIEIKLDLEEYEDVVADNGNDWTLDQPVLLVKFNVDRNKRTTVVYLPSVVEKIMGIRQSLNPADFTPDLQLLTYVDHVKDQMINYIDLLVQSRLERKEFIESFLKRLPGNLLEYDGRNFVKISLLFSRDDFFYIVHISLARTFPREQPILTFESAYHLNRRNQPFQMACHNYTYSPRWSINDIVDRIKSLIIEKANLFREKSFEQGII